MRRLIALNGITCLIWGGLAVYYSPLYFVPFAVWAAVTGMALALKLRS